MHAFDRQTDTFLIASPRWHFVQREKNSFTVGNSNLQNEYNILHAS